MCHRSHVRTSFLHKQETIVLFTVPPLLAIEVPYNNLCLHIIFFHSLQEGLILLYVELRDGPIFVSGGSVAEFCHIP